MDLERRLAAPRVEHRAARADPVAALELEEAGETIVSENCTRPGPSCTSANAPPPMGRMTMMRPASDIGSVRPSLAASSAFASTLECVGLNTRQSVKDD
jgi:hypothetical protein